MSETFTIKIDGRECVALQGETVLQVARREGIQIPTLCDDKRLDPAGACRAHFTASAMSFMRLADALSTSQDISKSWSGSTDPSLAGRSRTWPKDARTL